MKTTQVRTKPFLTTLALMFLCISLLTGCGNTDTTPKDKQAEVPEKEPIQEIFDGAGNTSGNYANGSDVAINDSSVFYCKYYSDDEFHGSSTGVPYTKVIKTDLNLDNEEELIDEFGSINNLNVVDDSLYAYSSNAKLNQEVFVNGKSFSQAEHTGMDGILKGTKYIETLIIQNNKLIYSEKELGANPFGSKCKGLYTCNLDGTDEEILVKDK